MEEDRDVGVERRPGHHGGVLQVAEAVHLLPFPGVAQQTVPAERHGRGGEGEEGASGRTSSRQRGGSPGGEREQIAKQVPRLAPAFEARGDTLQHLDELPFFFSPLTSIGNK